MIIHYIQLHYREYLVALLFADLPSLSPSFHEMIFILSCNYYTPYFYEAVNYQKCESWQSSNNVIHSKRAVSLLTDDSEEVEWRSGGFPVVAGWTKPAGGGTLYGICQSPGASATPGGGCEGYGDTESGGAPDVGG